MTADNRGTRNHVGLYAVPTAGALPARQLPDEGMVIPAAVEAATGTPLAAGTVDRVAWPHDDIRILHPIGECHACDSFPAWQTERIRQRVLFTGEPPRAGWLPCPSERPEPDSVRTGPGRPLACTGRSARVTLLDDYGVPVTERAVEHAAGIQAAGLPGLPLGFRPARRSPCVVAAGGQLPPAVTIFADGRETVVTGRSVRVGSVAVDSPAGRVLSGQAPVRTALPVARRYFSLSTGYIMRRPTRLQRAASLIRALCRRRAHAGQSR